MGKILKMGSGRLEHDEIMQEAMDETGCLLDIGISWYADNMVEYYITRNEKAFPAGVPLDVIREVLTTARKIITNNEVQVAAKEAGIDVELIEEDDE